MNSDVISLWEPGGKHCSGAVYKGLCLRCIEEREMWAVTCKQGKILQSCEVFYYYILNFCWRGNFNFRKWFQASSSVGYFSLNKSDCKLVPNDFSVIKLA